jgi:hypothetical protein
MKKSELSVGARYAVLHAGTARRRNADPDPSDVCCMEVVDLDAPAPHPDERLTTVTSRWRSPSAMTDPDPAKRPRGVLARRVDQTGRVTGPPSWYDGGTMFVADWDSWCDRLSMRSTVWLRRQVNEAGDAGLRLGWSATVRPTYRHRFEPVGDVVPVTVLDADGERGGLPVMGRDVPGDARGAVVVDDGGRSWFVADRHHLFEHPDRLLSAATVEQRRADRKAALGAVLGEQAMEMLLGRWAPSGNRYRDQPGFDERNPDDPMPEDAAWLTYRAGWDADTVEVGLETFMVLMSLDDDTRSRFAEQIAEVMTGDRAPVR